MLGNKTGEERGRVTSRRILPGRDHRFVRMEITFEMQGSLLGVEGTDIGTYTMFERIPGQLYGEGQGIFETREGGAIWNGHGVGHAADNGDMVFAYSIAFQTDAPKLAALNKVLVVGEHRVTMDGAAQATAWEWKA